MPEQRRREPESGFQLGRIIWLHIEPSQYVITLVELLDWVS